MEVSILDDYYHDDIMDKDSTDVIHPGTDGSFDVEVEVLSVATRRTRAKQILDPSFGHPIPINLAVIFQ